MLPFLRKIIGPNHSLSLTLTENNFSSFKDHKATQHAYIFQNGNLNLIFQSGKLATTSHTLTLTAYPTTIFGVPLPHFFFHQNKHKR